MNSQKDYKDYIDDLFKYKDIEFAKFSERIIKSNYKIVGIRTPILQKEAKKLIRDYDNYFKYARFDSYEEVFLYGLVLANLKDYQEYRKYLNCYIPAIDSWGLVDSFVAKSKVIEKNLEENFKYIKELTKSKEEFESRVGYIMLLDYYISDQYYREIYKIIDMNKNMTYYNLMAISWLLSEMLVKYYDETVEYLNGCKLDKFTFNKAIQKACESYRISDERKIYLKSMKIK